MGQSAGLTWEVAYRIEWRPGRHHPSLESGLETSLSTFRVAPLGLEDTQKWFPNTWSPKPCAHLMPQQINFHKIVLTYRPSKNNHSTSYKKKAVASEVRPQLGKSCQATSQELSLFDFWFQDDTFFHDCRPHQAPHHHGDICCKSVLDIHILTQPNHKNSFLVVATSGHCEFSFR